MFCKNCGSPIGPGDMFCKNCGTPVENGQPMENEPMMDNNQEPNMNNLVNSSSMMDNSQMMNNNQGFGMNNQYNQSPMMNNNQSYNNGPMMNNWQNTYPANQQGNNNATAMIIGGICLAAIVLIVVLLSSGKNNDTNNYSNSNSNSNTNTNVVAKSTYSKTFQGFKFSIPNDYLSEIDSDRLIITDDVNWVIGLAVTSKSFSTIDRNATKTNLERMGYTVSKSDLRKIDGVEYLIYELTYSGDHTLVAYGKLDSSNTFGIECYNVSNQYDYSLLNKFAPIAKSAQRSYSSNSISINSTIDMNDVLATE